MVSRMYNVSWNSTNSKQLICKNEKEFENSLLNKIYKWKVNIWRCWTLLDIKTHWYSK
jgi:hypothetical protein